MSQSRSRTGLLGRAHVESRRKRLGQYFTGTGLGRLLAALAGAEHARSILDPMAGSGDLLASCLEIGARPALLVGIEIDSEARDACAQRLPDVECIRGNAFDAKTISRLPQRSFDLVIANPPYVRYQSFANEAGSNQELPSANEIREGLLSSLQQLPALDAEDRRLFSHLVGGYSGLSDMAVPSWILCAGLVAPGGRLALVVPESWLTRDYAAVVHYMLYRWFDVEFFVEDEHASWFDDAQVKTMLVVARRVERRASVVDHPASASYCHIAVSASAASAQSPIGQAAKATGVGLERSFASQARGWLTGGSRIVTDILRVTPVSLAQACRNALATASGQKWFAAMGEFQIPRLQGAYLPLAVHAWLETRGIAPSFRVFEDEGISVGQGLRTGANSFFYAKGARHGNQVALTFSGPLAGETANAPLEIARPVLRRQAELPLGYVLRAEEARAWALDLRRHALPEDLATEDPTSTHLEVIPESLATLVRAAALANFGSESHPKRVWELTAVSPNARPAARGLSARHWYMLPDLAPRHTPDVFIARVNSTTPKAYLNSGRACLVDANFSTMWIRSGSRWCPYALLALMNSAWAQSVLETSGAVLGGGALKVEAAHLRRFPLPVLDDSGLAELALLGEKLTGPESSVGKLLLNIDSVVGNALGCGAAEMASLRQIAVDGQERRARHKK